MFRVRYIRNGVEDVRFFTIALFADMWIEEQKELSKKYAEDFEVIDVKAIML